MEREEEVRSGRALNTLLGSSTYSKQHGNQNYITQRVFQVGTGDRRGRRSQTKRLVSRQPSRGKTEALNKDYDSRQKKVSKSTCVRRTETWSGEKHYQYWSKWIDTERKLKTQYSNTWKHRHFRNCLRGCFFTLLKIIQKSNLFFKKIKLH